MTLELSVYLENVNELMDAGWTHVRVYRHTAPEPIASFTALVGTQQALVADQTDYEIEDTTGGPGHWYRTALFNGSQLSTLGDPWQPDLTTLLDVMAAGAERAGAGFKSTCTSTGTVSSLVDARLIESGVAADFLQGAYLYRPDATAADKLRRVASGGFDFTTGALRPARAWAVEPTEDEEYHVYLLLPPFDLPGAGYSWAAAARDGLQECEYEDRLDIGTGTSARVDEFDLGVHLGYLRENDIRGVELEQYDATSGAVISRWDAGKRGRFYKTKPNGRGSLKLILRPAPTTQQHIIVTANRRDAELYAADDVTGCPLRLASRATAWKAYEYLNLVHGGKYGLEEERALQAFLAEYSGEIPTATVQT